MLRQITCCRAPGVQLRLHRGRSKLNLPDFVLKDRPDLPRKERERESSASARQSKPVPSIVTSGISAHPAAPILSSSVSSDLLCRNRHLRTTTPAGFSLKLSRTSPESFVAKAKRDWLAYDKASLESSVAVDSSASAYCQHANTARSSPSTEHVESDLDLSSSDIVEDTCSVFDTARSDGPDNITVPHDTAFAADIVRTHTSMRAKSGAAKYSYAQPKEAYTFSSKPIPPPPWDIYAKVSVAALKQCAAYFAGGSRKWRSVATCANPLELRRSIADFPEVAFAGAVGCGKSSLLNALLGGAPPFNGSSLVPVGAEAPSTRSVQYICKGSHFKEITDTDCSGVVKRHLWNKCAVGDTYRSREDSAASQRGLFLVDLPGYSACDGTDERFAPHFEATSDLLGHYLFSRHFLRRLFLVVDATRGLRQGDFDFLAYSSPRMWPVQFVVSKADLVSHKDLCSLITEIYVHAMSTKVLDKPFSCVPHVLVTSSMWGEGMTELRMAIALATDNFGTTAVQQRLQDVHEKPMNPKKLFSNVSRELLSARPHAIKGGVGLRLVDVENASASEVAALREAENRVTILEHSAVASDALKEAETKQSKALFEYVHCRSTVLGLDAFAKD